MSQTDPESWKQLHELIDEIRIGMLTTRTRDGGLRSRPMLVHHETNGHDASGELWFFTHADDAKADEIRREAQVNVSFSCPQINSYVSVSGSAELVRDPRKMRQMWEPGYQTWFPDGLDDPDLALMRVSIDGAEYWDAPSGAMIELAEPIRAPAGGDAAPRGENVKLGEMRSGPA